MSVRHRSAGSKNLSTRKKTSLKRVLLALLALVGFSLGSPIDAQVFYTNGENDATNYTLTENTNFLTILGGTETAERSGTKDLSTFNSTFNILDPADQLPVSGVISGSGLLGKSGSGTLVLSGTNTFTGGITLTAGTLQLLSTGTVSGSLRGITVEGNGTTINNSGLIEGLGTTVGSFNSDAAIKLGAANGTVINNLAGGVITGTTFGIVSSPEDVSLNTTINNQGTITGINNDGVRLIGGGTIINSGRV